MPMDYGAGGSGMMGGDQEVARPWLSRGRSRCLSQVARQECVAP